MQASHTTTTTTTRITTSSSSGYDGVSLHIPYLASTHGILKILQLVFGVLCFGLVVGAARKVSYSAGLAMFAISGDAAALMLVSFMFFVTSFFMIIASVLSFSTASSLPRTLFYLVFHLFSVLLHLPTGIATIIIASTNKIILGSNAWRCYVAGGVFGLFTALAYVATVLIVFRSGRSS